MGNKIIVPGMRCFASEVRPLFIAFACPLVAAHVAKGRFRAEMRQHLSIFKPDCWVEDTTHVLHVEVIPASHKATVVRLDLEGRLLKR